MPSLTIYCVGANPHYLLDLPGQPLVVGDLAIVITSKSTHIREMLTLKGLRILSTLRELEVGPRATFNGTQLRIFIRQHRDERLQKLVERLQPIVGEIKVTTK